ncbi:hypothetical protein EAI89_09360 [Eubacterium sp. am_0171]|uniref:Uncharacterized protein n=1 Tax=Faecalicatena contorta TaxID=39482 RepID=A0A174I963_9FIRM|nr:MULTISPECIES: hypothetical protein [Clostridia]MSC83825.1 hypothetical protein [Eubacterium sp. BIOML-A1]MSD06385.1 hypothetical protein [Eubacterium sp. BIOML-A2]RYT20293.1 hypothetical protein EAI89_09360 [Eubacterium sp. am_0171]CUO82596.1 Uncharacterised protein [[Eubacterium] contortum] [Faecalicatena contorta]
MFKNVAADTNVIFYLMIAVGVIGVLAKLVNQVTLRRLVKASGNMSKSTHKLMKLVRAKYEHACMIHDKVDNVGAFVEKYIYEYRGFLFKVHTWRQLEIQSIWFSGILAALGAAGHYLAHGLCEEMYQYIAVGAAEMVALFVISQLSDESYKVKAAKNYMVDYLENVCAHRYKKVKQTEKENIDVISPETAGASRAAAQREEPALSINIEGEPRRVEKGEAARQVIRRTVKEKMEEDDEQPALKEEAIRQILEEFLA